MTDSAVCESVLEHTEEESREASNATDDRHRDLVAWAIDRHAEEDTCPAQIYNAIRASGWTAEDTVDALIQALPPELHGQLPLFVRAAPKPDFSATSSSVTIDGHTVQVLCEMRNPHLVVFGNLLSPEECRELMLSAETRLERSMVTGDGWDSLESNVRTSSGMFFERDETPLYSRIEARISALLDWPLLCSEEMQVLRYGKSQEYEPHHDYFEPESGVWAPVFRRGGQRVASMVIYLNTPESGGSTVFPDLPLEVRAVAGNAVFFAYETADVSSRTLHAGAPVGEGEKWVAVKWFRQGPFI